MTGNDTIACVMLNWNGNVQILDSVRSVLASKNVSVDVIIIDNGSSDGSDRQIAQEFPNVIIMKQQHNLGVAKAWNIAASYVLGKEYPTIFFLNSDAAVQSDCLFVLNETLQNHPDAGIVTPRILDATNNTLWFDGGKRNLFGDVVHRNFGKPLQFSEDCLHEDFATGCAMLVRTPLFKTIGFFDEQFFAYSEDADFCFKAERAGWSIIHQARAKVSHTPSSSVKHNKGAWFRDYYVVRNKLMLMKSELNGVMWFMFLGYFSIKYFLIPVAYYIISGQFKRVIATLNGIIDYRKGKFGERYS